jgi:hypothetical protein
MVASLSSGVIGEALTTTVSIGAEGSAARAAESSTTSDAMEIDSCALAVRKRVNARIGRLIDMDCLL